MRRHIPTCSASCPAEGRATASDLSPALKEGLQNVFAASNARLARTTGLLLADATRGHHVQYNRLSLDKLFSFKMQNRLTTLEDVTMTSDV
jgi:hypothetical protein